MKKEQKNSEIKSQTKKIVKSNQLNDNQQLNNIDNSVNINQKPDRVDWLKNQAIIQEAYIKLIQQSKRCPTVLEISKETNLSVAAIKNHVKFMKFEPQQSPLRSLTPDVLISIYNSSRKGQSASQKLWVQLMEGWSENMNLNISGSVEERIRNMTEEDRQKRIEQLKKKINA